MAEPEKISTLDLSRTSVLVTLPPSAYDIQTFLRQTLMPCPFCTGSGQTNTQQNERTKLYVGRVFCTDCGASVTRSDADRTEAERGAFIRWNTRPPHVHPDDRRRHHPWCNFSGAVRAGCKQCKRLFREHPTADMAAFPEAEVIQVQGEDT